MKWFRVIGFSKYNVWSMVEVKTIKEHIAQRAKEKGVVEIIYVEEI